MKFLVDESLSARVELCSHRQVTTPCTSMISVYSAHCSTLTSASCAELPAPSAADGAWHGYAGLTLLGNNPYKAR